MAFKKKSIFIAFFFTFLFVVPLVFAATSADFQTKAQKYIDNNCDKKKLTNQKSLLCYLFYKSQEQEATLAQHETRITDLETSASEPKTVIFADNRPQPFNSEWVDVRGGYTSLTLSLSITGSISDYGVHFTNDPENATDQTGYTVQTFVHCNNASTCPVTTIPILGDYYQISTGTANGNITATGILRKEQGYSPDKVIKMCFNVANGSLRVLQAANCGSDVQWEVPVKCVSGQPCKPDNPNDPYYLNNN